MALIVDYASLGQAIVDFAHRADIASYQDYFIQAAQENLAKDLIRANMGNGVRFMEETLTPVAITAGTIPVPGDWIAPKTFQVTDGQGSVSTLDFKDSDWLYAAYPIREPSGEPQYIARDGANFVFGPYPDDGYTITGTYYGSAPLLSTNTTNWMVTTCPFLLHAYCMIEAGKFLKDPDMVSGWSTVASDKLDSLVNQDKAERYGSGTLAIQAA